MVYPTSRVPKPVRGIAVLVRGNRSLSQRLGRAWPTMLWSVSDVVASTCCFSNDTIGKVTVMAVRETA